MGEFYDISFTALTNSGTSSGALRLYSRPELKSYPESIDEYDVIYLGFPNYWSIMPMAVFTFLEHFDFSGKTVIPFCTSASSGLGESGELLKEAAGKGNWLEGIRFSSNVSETQVKEWLKTIAISYYF